MCGRYVVARAVGDLVDAFEVEEPDDVTLAPSWNIAPTTDVPVILERLIDGEVHRQLHVARWGLVPVWARSIDVGVRSFNARSETVTEKPTFRSAVKARRCAVPADGYYEWKKLSAKSKQPYYVHPQDDSPIAFAGLYEWWKDPTKEEGAPDQWLLSTTILTCAAPPADSGNEVLTELGQLHDRLPVPMDKDTMAAWLDPENKDADALVELVRSQAYAVAGEWTLVPVDAAVGNVRNNSPDLIKPESSLF